MKSDIIYVHTIHTYSRKEERNMNDSLRTVPERKQKLLNAVKKKILMNSMIAPLAYAYGTLTVHLR